MSPTMRPLPLEKRVIEIGSDDGDYYLERVPTGKTSRKTGKPEYKAFLCNKKDDHIVIPTDSHVDTNDPIISNFVRDKVATMVPIPSNLTAERVEIRDGDCSPFTPAKKRTRGRKNYVGTRVFASYEDLDYVMAWDQKESGVPVTWEKGDAKRLEHEYIRNVHSCTHLDGKTYKESASGNYVEFGFATSPGKHNGSYSLNPDDPGSRVQLVHRKGEGVEREIGESTSNVATMMAIYMKWRCPDLYKNNLEGQLDNRIQYWNHNSRSKAVMDAFAFPPPPTEGKLKYSDCVLYSNQCAVRTAGISHGASDKFKRKAITGGSGMHVDGDDPELEYGSHTVYCSMDENENDSNVDEDEDILPENDIIAFQNEHGGRAACLATMTKKGICTVFLKTNRKLHGTPFPNHNQQLKSRVGQIGVRLVMYQNKQIQKMVRYFHNSQGAFAEYLIARKEHVKKLQNKDANYDKFIENLDYAYYRLMEKYSSNRKQNE